MVLMRQVYLICDGPGDGFAGSTACVDMTGQWFAHNAKEARQIAKQLGWVRIGQKDFCNNCKKRIAAQDAES